MKVNNCDHQKIKYPVIMYDLVIVCTGVGRVLEIATRLVADQSGYQG
jgi:hypothetical protein